MKSPAFYVVRKKGWLGRFFTPSKQEADKLLEPATTIVDSFNSDGTPYGSYGCVFATQVDLNRQLEHKNQLVHNGSN